jgi:hypothetical protein
MNEMYESLSRYKGQLEERNESKSTCQYEGNYVHNSYDSHHFPHSSSKSIDPISSNKSQSQPRPYNQSIRLNDSSTPIRHPKKIPSRKARVVRNPAKPSPFDFSEIYGAPHLMPNNYSERLPRFYGNYFESIENHLQVFWDYVEVRGADDEDVYMRALGVSLGGNVGLWFDHLASGFITGYDMFTGFLNNKWGSNIDEFISEPSSNDCAIEDIFYEDHQDNDDDTSNQFLSSPSLDPKEISEFESIEDPPEKKLLNHSIISDKWGHEPSPF